MIRKATIIVLTLATAILCSLAVVSIWRPVYWYSASLEPNPKDWIWCVFFTEMEGGILVEVGDSTSHARYLAKWPSLFEAGEFSEPGFHFDWRKRPTPAMLPLYEWTRIRMPLWMPILAFAVYPTIAFIRGPLRRRRRRKRNQCIHCGYNLTGLPEPRCPECGKDT